MRVLRSSWNSDEDIGVVHGDIKPQNVLVFKDAITRKTTVKVADFGYSTLTAGESGMVFLPKSRPWNAPEHHFGGFEAHEAKKTDVYSFGILCLWVIFGPTLLERLKDEDSAEYIANSLVESMPGLNVEYRFRLKEVFSLTLPHNPGNRTCDLAGVIGLLRQKQLVSPWSI